MVIYFVCLVPVKLLLSRIVVLYRVNVYIVAAICYFRMLCNRRDYYKSDCSPQGNDILMN